MSSATAAKDTSEGTAVILGASGAVGKPLLSLLVGETSPYSTVYSFARRAHPSPPTVSSHVQYHEVLVDFEKIYNNDDTETAKLSSSLPSAPQAVFITMGTTRAAAGGMANFEKIDRGYVLSAAKALLQPEAQTTMLYCSSSGGNSSSFFPYLKSKGLTEEGLANLYAKTVIVKPGYLQNANRPETRTMEAAAAPLMNLLSRFSGSIQAPVTDVAKAMLKAAQLGPEGLKKDGTGKVVDKGFKLEDEGKRDDVVTVDNASVLKLARLV